MAGTRSQSRGETASQSPQSSQTSPAAAGSKRKAASNASSPQAKSQKQQKTLEETVGANDGADNDGTEFQNDSDNQKKETNGSAEHTNGNAEHSSNKEETKQNGAVKPSDVIEESSQRASAMPSNVLEKGIIYFFSRGRVNVDSPSSVQDIARSYMVLRPLPDGAKLNAGPLPDASTNRLLALPKKVLPKTHKDAFMTFVEKAGTTVAELKEEFLKGSEYETKTTGVSHSPPVTPLGEGVYAITHTGNGRTSHLAYVLTLPQKLGEVQEQMGLHDRGSFVLSVKNPEFPGPANAALDKKPDFPKDVQEEFRGRRWAPLDPKHLDYENVQLLLIGEARGELGKAVEAEEKDKASKEQETPEEEIEKLEMEDLKRAESLNHEDAVFADLGISKKEYPEMKTTW